MRSFKQFRSARLISALFVLLVLVTLRAEAAGAEPSEVVRKFNASLLEAMKRADQLGYQGRYKLLGPAISNSFDLSFMASQSAGRYWRTLNESQKSQLVETFTDWTIATYAARFDGYSGEEFEVVSESPARDGIATVVSKLKKAGGDIDFHYLLKKSGNSWRIIDIQISGVSQLALTRAQFSDVLKTKGVDGLVAMLKGKIEEYSKGEKK